MSALPATTIGPDWAILCDFDGTVVFEDVTDALLARFAGPGWERLEQEWRAGRIGSRQCMAGQIALLDADCGELDTVIDAARIDPAFADFVRAARQRDIPIGIVSDGLDYAIDRILDRHGLDDLPITANRLLQADSRRWCMRSPHARAGCRSASGTCKCACVNRQRAEHRRTLLIGDGRSDFCAAGSADFVFAKHRLIKHCRDSGIAHWPIAGFRDALALLPELLQAESVPACAPPLETTLRVRMA